MTATKLSRRAFTGTLLATTALSACAVQTAPAKAHVVVIGGGFGGATAAKFLRLEDPGIAVTMIEPKDAFVTCPFSNYVIAGFKRIDEITHSYAALTSVHGVRHVRDMAAAIDPAAKTVRTAGGQTFKYDKLVVSPGIDIRWGALEGYTEAAAERLPHAWAGGPQTLLLRRQLEAMPDGGVVALSLPGNPFRCPPGPYERISVIAHYLKANKPRSKILALDAKDAFSKQGLFQDGWNALYPGMIEWVPLGKDGRVVRVLADEMTLVSEFGERHRANVINVVPPQFAGRIARDAGLAATEGGMAGWCPVDPFTFESTRAKDIHVIGDASIAGAMPKSGFAANSQGKFVAKAIAAALNGRPTFAPVFANTCYSLLAPEYGISVADIFRATPQGIVAVQGAGGVSPRTPQDAAQHRLLEARYAYGWYSSTTREVWGA
ncbi:MAG: FAD-dependent oxidoreductase [Azospirillum sp.]|nr:FAD-dependent oxidoreductase [Azospirillum sp.]MCA3267331.1 FAD-dependent oxidoreductase [Azospirillum sp.]MCZ8125203.1 NAD(P)/FAD-dependent oxidoreductase [Magnetospirillum sp.]